MKLLHIDSSILGDNSASRQLSRAVVDAWVAAQPAIEVTYRDLAAEPISHFSALTLAAGATAPEERNEVLKYEAEISETTMKEFLEADAVVIGAPMYNFSISSQLKAWFDRLAVAGKTFAYTENGPKGLAGGKKVIIATSAGGQHAGQPSGYAHEEYVKLMLAFFGITDVQVVRAEGLAFGADARAASINAAQQQISTLFR
ncbi:FMN-dependent NADH-azoreductase [Pseudomonas sp. TTU2014-080ASC]|uniref:FMN-dependent NADH-azoreductase n=1 Tax=Pseudomonas sp. TTU2014-080ASC TaxID=1729724 RepID=UPI0007186A16|nr:NAD(P)H-dependent oxidoreductase [Pseudomonas sp. TTU2014-080ASC]KRW58146.1 FMN-dependent NADH-azoreductase [Pseudomonas sp. TTU2014-080ASC]